MIRFAVCDDNLEDLKNIVEIINTCVKNNEDVQIDVFSNGADLLKVTDTVRYDAFFLDIDMPNMNGLDISARIREKDAYSEIIFITVRDECVYESIQFKPFRFIRKQFLKKELEVAVEELLDVISKYNFYLDENECKIPVSEVYYLEYERRRIKVYTKDELFYIYGKMTQYENVLGKYNYIRVHSGFLVNMRYILKYRSEYVQLYNGKEIPVGRKFYAKSKDQFLRYVLGD